jgi:hypothetical protein
MLRRAKTESGKDTGRPYWQYGRDRGHRLAKGLQPLQRELIPGVEH